MDGTTTTYVLDTASSLTMVLAESTTGEAPIYYLHGLDLVAQSDTTTTEYFGYDGLGSVRQVFDAAGDPVMTQTFDPYGGRYGYAGPESVTSVGYTGEFEDGNGLLFLRARFYNAASGRFLNMDPSRQEVNSYAYVGGNPVMYFDPSGLCFNVFNLLTPTGGDWSQILNECAENVQTFNELNAGNDSAMDSLYLANWYLNPGGVTARNMVEYKAESIEHSNSVFYGAPGYNSAAEYRACEPLEYFNDVVFVYTHYILPPQLIVFGNAVRNISAANTTREFRPDNLPANPDELLQAGWQETTDTRTPPSMRQFTNPSTGDVVEFHQGQTGRSGWSGRDHYHWYNPLRTNRGDWYLDIHGNPVPKNSRPSHLSPYSPE